MTVPDPPARRTRRTRLLALLAAACPLFAAAQAAAPAPAAPAAPAAAASAATAATNAVPAVSVTARPEAFLFLFAPEGLDLDTEVRHPESVVPPDFAWLYAEIPADERACDALGIGGVALTPNHPWRKRYRPDPIPRRNLRALRHAAAAPLPLVCDLAIAPDSHGAFENMEGVIPDAGCWPEPASTSVRWSVTTELGREHWLHIWSADLADFKQTIRAVPDAVRLFADADPQNRSTWGRSAILRRIRREYKTIADVNKAWEVSPPLNSFPNITRLSGGRYESFAAHLIYANLEEDCFAELVRRAGETLGVPVFFQPAADALPGLDPVTANAASPLLSAPARTEHPLLTARYCLAVAKGRPVFSPEIRLTDDPAAIRSAVLAELARGYAAATLAPLRPNPRAWTRYGRNASGRLELDQAATAAAGAARPKRPDDVLNPYVLSPVALSNGLAAAREAVREALPWFTPGKPATETNTLAILHSRAAERVRACHRLKLSAGAPWCEKTLPLADFVDAAVFSFYPTEILLERDVAAIPAHIRAILVPDCIDACRPETAPALRAWVEQGGTLLINPNSLSRTVTGAPRKPAPFADFPTNTLETLSAVRVQPLGKGRILRFDPGKNVAELSAVLQPLLREAGVNPILNAVHTDSGKPVIGLEAVRAPASGGAWAYLLFNRTNTPLTFRASLPGSENAVDYTLPPQRGDLFLLAP